MTAHTVLLSERGWDYINLILCVVIGWIGPATHTPRVPINYLDVVVVHGEGYTPSAGLGPFSPPIVLSS